MEQIKAAAQTALDGGGKTARQRHVSRGKILPRERVSRCSIRARPFLEVGMLAAHGMYDGAAPSAGMIAGIGRVEGRRS
jgi:3-methylcrotonyl-CoA carboxylase beta subunit